MNRDLLLSELIRDEGKRAAVYDDADGSPIKPGTMVKGHPTIGVGRALDVNPLSEVEIRFLLNSDVDKVTTGISQALSWFETLDDVRQRVIVNMAFNMGVSGLLSFREMLSHVQRGEYPQAAIAMEESHWYKQVGARAGRLCEMMRTGSVA